ncbi:PD-(D/E)XK motif protein [Leifsonia sp. NPDC056824]|uniref:PD-(D/E)XK motif protein n=1 Tax=Leifsonia sp. NPDC056824 TaxID=3345953 RepID=UPI0036AAFE16
MNEQIPGQVEILDAFKMLQDRALNDAVPVDGYVVIPLSRARDDLYLGWSSADELALIVVTEPSAILPPPVRLAALSADFGTFSLLSENGQERSLRVSSLRCSSSENSVADIFATVCSSLAKSLAIRPREHELSFQIARWAGLFWRLAQRVDTDVVGLAGELVVMCKATRPDEWLGAWHADPDDTLDFVFTRGSVEVKTTRGSTRQHPVSLEQVSKPGTVERYFASVQVDIAESGEPIGDVVRELSDRIGTDHARLKLWNVLAKSCGAGLDEVLHRRFDIAQALASVRFYGAKDIPRPRIDEPLPNGVTRVKFTSDFALAHEIGLQQVELALGVG